MAKPHCVVFSARHFTYFTPLHPGVKMGTGGYPCDGQAFHPSRGGGGGGGE